MKALVLLPLGLLAGGCSTQSVQRTIYETLESARLETCRRQHDETCGQRTSYEQYLEHRKRVKKRE